MAALVLACVGLTLAVSSAGVRAQAVSPTAPVSSGESASDALSRHLRVLAGAPRNFQALIGAGRAALDLGDTQAAAGFFGRADEVWPTSPMPQIGMGAATALDGDPTGALRHFERARQLGATPASMGADRGLAYDLLGRHAEAQADYRAAFAGAQADEARRRLALSLAVTGQKDPALSALAPLLQRRDPAAIRSRALVLALTGDQTGARQAIEYTMPGGWAQLAPFLGRLASLNSAQKSAAVNLGIFPGSEQPGGSAVASVETDRLAAIDQLLRGTPPPATAPQPGLPQAQLPRASSTQPQLPQPGPSQPQAQARSSLPGPVFGPPAPVSSPAVAAVSTAAAGAVPSPRRYWVQLASGPNATALPEQFRRTKARTEDLLDGISGYVAEEVGRARLLIGPFRNQGDAQIFIEDLETAGVRASSWVSAEGQQIRKITTE